jgi:signal transduction histidine kinase
MHSTASKDPNEDGPERQTEPGIMQMISKAKEQQNEMKALRLTLRNGLQQHESVVSELREDMAEYADREEPGSVVY